MLVKKHTTTLPASSLMFFAATLLFLFVYGVRIMSLTLAVNNNNKDRGGGPQRERCCSFAVQTLHFYSRAQLQGSVLVPGIIELQRDKELLLPVDSRAVN
jgi:hypothetical protein